MCLIVTAAPAEIPDTLLKQLKIGGRLIVPVGSDYQTLMRFTRDIDKIKEEHFGLVRFVPMVNK